MTDEAMSPLRRRMIEDMTIRKLAPKTQQGYIRTVKDFSAFLGRSPDRASFEDVRRFQLHLAANGAHIPILNHTVAALRFFFRVTLKRSGIIEHTAFLHEPRKLPVVLDPEEVARLLDAAPGLKYKAALSVAYGAGLRAAEVVSLKVSDIDSKRMIIRVEQGKGGPGPCDQSRRSACPGQWRVWPYPIHRHCAGANGNVREEHGSIVVVYRRDADGWHMRLVEPSVA